MDEHSKGEAGNLDEGEPRLDLVRSRIPCEWRLCRTLRRSQGLCQQQTVSLRILKRP